MAEHITEDRTPTGADASPTGDQPRGSKAPLVILALIVLLGGGLLYKYWGFWQSGQQQAAPPAPQVTVATPVTRDLVEWAEFSGRFQAMESVEIRARVSGYLESINFTDGQLVKKGDLLFVIEPRPYELALETAKADLAEAKANLQLAKVQLERTSKLKQKDFAAQATLDERKATVETGQASVESAQAALGQAELNLDYTRVVAPMAGKVSQHEVSVGNLIVGGTSGQTTLLTDIVTLDPIHFVFNVSEADGLSYQKLLSQGALPTDANGDVQVQGESLEETDWPLRGKIDFIDNQYSTSTGTITIRALFPNKQMVLTPGQFGRVRVPMSKKQPTLLVPDSAVVTDQDSKILFTVDKDNKVVPKQVQLGPVFGDNLRMVRSGIEPDDRIIINGLLRARPGAEVAPEEGKIDASSVKE